MRRLIAILAVLVSVAASAQTTKVRGRVTDADTGEGIPFAGLFFKGTTIGITSDMDGYYNLETRDNGAKVLVCQLLGYDTREKEVRAGAFTQVDFALKLTDNKLTGAVVKADNRKVRRLLANIDRNRDRNNPDAHQSYSCDIYTKMELDLTHAKEQITNRKFLREFGFVFDYMDTSSISGVPYLPVMISESVSKRRHTLKPDADYETIVANRISGINPDNNLLSQFSGSMHIKVNFYRPFINAFDVEFPSPIQNGGLLFYNYFIIDSLQVDSRKTYLVRYHPKPGISSPALDGEMYIDAEDYALRSVHAKMMRGGNVNWLRDIVFDAQYQRMPDSTWFYKEDNLYADFSIALGDSSKVMSVLGNRQMSYSNPDFSGLDMLDTSNGPVEVLADSNHHDESYWASVRPYELSRKEKDIYTMVDAIKEVPLYQTFYDIIYTAVNGYWDIGKVGIGPYSKVISFNNLEGCRLGMGVHTSRAFSTKHRITAFVAYGFRDRQWKGGLSYDRIFCREKTRKLTLDARYDVFQLGRSTSAFTDGNILASVFGKGNAQRLCPMTNFSATYEHEFSINVNARADVALKRYYGNSFVPMFSPDGEPMHSVASNEIHLGVRFSKEETVNRGYYVKNYIHTIHPVLSFDVTGGMAGIRNGDYSFLRPEVTLEWKFRIPPVGMSKIYANAGVVIGQVPYPLLHLPEGNGTYLLDKKAFSCMDYFEFASDTWVTLFWNHNFNGFFLGKIPLLRRLNLREEFTFKMAYGTLRDENNALLRGTTAPMAFPKGMRTIGKVPYMEVGAGISNILRVLRVDCFWRLTHREGAGHQFAVTLGAEFRF